MSGRNRLRGTLIVGFAVASIQTLTAQGGPAIPAALTSSGDIPVMTLSASGTQIYECRANAAGTLEWIFKEPRADLILNGVRIGRHYAGPTWEHDDKSLVKGKVAARADAPGSGDIPWLRLEVVANQGAGAFAGVSVIQRINTRGGTLAGACLAAGQAFEVPYLSDYILVRRPS